MKEKHKKKESEAKRQGIFGNQLMTPMQEGHIMKTISKTLQASVAATLLIASIPPLAQGRDARGSLHIKGTVVCAKFSLDEVRNTQSAQEQLYQFTHAQGPIVMRVRSVNDSPTWRYFGWPSEVQVRAREEVYQKLMAEENMFKDVEIEGALSTTKALDIFDVAIKG
jgi:hypothetical protein